jgi:predicted AAA+ superfamily ATPase
MLASHLNEPRRIIQVVAGPRQVDKTTLVGGDGVAVADFLTTPLSKWLGT